MPIGELVTTAFILLMCMIIMNLFFGIAVSNVDKVLRDSQMYAQINLLKMIKMTDSTLRQGCWKILLF